MHKLTTSNGANRRVVLAIAALIAAYVVFLFCGGGSAPGGYQGAHHATSVGAGDGARDGSNHQGASGEHAAGAAAHAAPGALPSMWSIAPFVILLAAIAIFPILPWTEHWWESNLHRFLVAISLALLTLLYYYFFFPHGGLHKVRDVLDHAVVGEYIPFIVLLFSLYTISGGIRIEGDIFENETETNAMFLTVGGLLASFIGTTGAAMLLIRPLIDTNDERKHVQHTIIFFVFVVCNCGGCLLPIGDPPLFLGYLKGVDFLWTLWNLWLPWLIVNTMLIGIYYAWDKFYFYPREERVDLQRDTARARPLRITGLWPNAVLLLGIILSVALLDPTKPVPGTEWTPWQYLREMVQLALVAASLLWGSAEIRTANRFNFHAIIEVAALFIGIFICMQPAIETLHIRGAELGLDSPRQLFWATGLLSSVLDNAPTYVVFFETAAADSQFAGEQFHRLVSESGELASVARQKLVGVSLGAVFLGAMTYIGNGPNFMVRAIAEQGGIRMPSFFGYVWRYSLPILVPVFILASFLCL